MSHMWGQDVQDRQELEQILLIPGVVFKRRGKENRDDPSQAR
jgi:hypothetical protein